MSKRGEWWKDAEDEVEADLRTRRALNQALLERSQEAQTALKKRRQLAHKKETEAPSQLFSSKFYSVRHFAEILGFSETTLYKWCKSGALKSKYTGGRYRIKEEWMADFLEQEDKKRAS